MTFLFWREYSIISQTTYATHQLPTYITHTHTPLYIPFYTNDFTSKPKKKPQAQSIPEQNTNTHSASSNPPPPANNPLPPTEKSTEPPTSQNTKSRQNRRGALQDGPSERKIRNPARARKARGPLNPGHYPSCAGKKRGGPFEPRGRLLIYERAVNSHSSARKAF